MSDMNTDKPLMPSPLTGGVIFVVYVFLNAKCIKSKNRIYYSDETLDFTNLKQKTNYILWL